MTQTKSEKSPRVTMQTEHGIIEIELWPDVAPKTVENFLTLISKGFYDGLSFHRIIPGFMIQGGCPQGTGMGGPGYQIKAEFNPRKHVRGVISMARSSHPDSAGSQFFIMHADSPHLDGQYTAFGMVITGIEVVDKIAAVKLSDPRAGSPVTKPKIIKVTTT
ncbi:MAG TPA: peptidylprolyl isomerase [Phycisphaerae bacterium]|nr:peptidylprolyl isomerase [Phycisphaerae bacterium]